MNLLFLTLLDFKNMDEKNIYTDLMREFIRHHDDVYVISPTERRNGEATQLIKGENFQLLKLKIGNIQKTNLIEKGISTLLIEKQFISAIKKYFKDIKFDIVMYSTPPITFAKAIKFVRKRDNAKSYLLLKDIFPQNAVDLGMFSKSSPIYKYFRFKEKQLYAQSDYIGCMSQANVDYVVNHNSFIDENTVHIAPNSIEVVENNISKDEKNKIRQKFNIPENTTVFVYGGNLGKPQDIPYLIECLKANENKKDRFFVICGNGTEYLKLKYYMEDKKPNNILLINGLPKDEYETLVATCDVGLIFLDYRFTIPNFPSRLLSYMQNSMPVLACTDENTDIGKVITDDDFGWWCPSNDVAKFTRCIDNICGVDYAKQGENARTYLEQNYTVEKSYLQIINCIK